MTDVSRELDLDAVVAAVEECGWAPVASAAGLTVHALRSTLNAAGIPLPAAPSASQRAASRRARRERALTEYQAELANRVYGRWSNPDIDDLLGGGEILDPSGRYAVTFLWKRISFTAAFDIDAVEVNVELLTARRTAGRPPLLRFIVYELDVLNRTEEPRSFGPTIERGVRWVARNQGLATHVHAIAMELFHELNPHAGLLDDYEAWVVEQDEGDRFDLMHGNHVWYCHDETSL